MVMTCLFKVCNNATRTTMLCRSAVFIVNFEYISCTVILIIFIEVPPPQLPCITGPLDRFDRTNQKLNLEKLKELRFPLVHKVSI